MFPGPFIFLFLHCYTTFLSFFLSQSVILFIQETMSGSSSRRRSMSVSAAPYLSQSDTTTSMSSSLWNSSNSKSTKTNFLSRFKSPSAVPTPSKSTSTNITTSLPPIHGQQRIKRKPIVSQQKTSVSASSSGTTPTPSAPRKKYEALLGIRTEDLISEGLNSKKVSCLAHNSLKPLFCSTMNI